MTFKIFVAGAILACSTIGSMGQAATLVVENGELTGATGVLVNGSYYDVTFASGQTCAELFSGCDDASDFVFTTKDAALAATIALLDQVFIATDIANYDTNPRATYGIDASPGMFMTPYASKDSTNFYYHMAKNFPEEVKDGGEYGQYSKTSVRVETIYDFAVWSEAAAPTATVPLPAGAWLLLSGIGGFGVLRKARRAA